MNVRTITLCQSPLVPLRGLVNSTYWRVHPLYVRHLKEFCVAENRQINQKNNNNSNNIQTNIQHNKNKNKNQSKNIGSVSSEKKNLKKITIEKDKKNDKGEKKVKNILVKNEKIKNGKQESDFVQRRKISEKEENSSFSFSCCPESWKEIVRTHTVGVRA